MDYLDEIIEETADQLIKKGQDIFQVCCPTEEELLERECWKRKIGPAHLFEESHEMIDREKLVVFHLPLCKKDCYLRTRKLSKLKSKTVLKRAAAAKEAAGYPWYEEDYIN